MSAVTSTDWSHADGIALGVLAQRGGIAPLRAFIEAGLSAEQVAAIYRRKVIARPRKGWYADPALPWQAHHAVRVGGVLACASAAAEYGLPVPPGGKLHVLMPHNAPRRRHNRNKDHHVVPGEDSEVELHWAPTDGTLPGWRTGLVDTLLLLVACVSIEWWIAAVDAALHVPRGGLPLVPPDGLAELRRRLPLRLQPELDRTNPLAGSCLETLLRLGLDARGISYVLQFSPRKWQFVDFLLPGKLIVEVDGAEWHDPVKDAERDAFFRALGYRVLRFDYARVVNDLAAVLDEIEAELSTAA